MVAIPARIAVVEDDAGVRTALRQLLRSAGAAVLAFASAEEFLDARRDLAVECVIADVNLPGISGVALVQRLHAEVLALPAVLITGRDDPATLAMMDQAGDVPRLRKPFSEAELFDAIRRATTT